MNKRQFYEVGLYCSLADKVVFLSVEKELVSMLGSVGYAIHSVQCLSCIDCGCQHYALSFECKTIIKQVVSIVSNDTETYRQY